MRRSTCSTTPTLPITGALVVAAARAFACLARELTKMHETVLHGELTELAAHIEQHGEQQQGEFVLVVHDQARTAVIPEGQRILECLLAELPLKTAVKLAAEISGQARNDLYERALALKKGE